VHQSSNDEDTEIKQVKIEVSVGSTNENLAENFDDDAVKPEKNAVAQNDSVDKADGIENNALQLPAESSHSNNEEQHPANLIGDSKVLDEDGKDSSISQGAPTVESEQSNEDGEGAQVASSPVAEDSTSESKHLSEETNEGQIDQVVDAAVTIKEDPDGAQPLTGSSAVPVSSAQISTEDPRAVKEEQDVPIQDSLPTPQPVVEPSLAQYTQRAKEAHERIKRNK
jgi:hypothetical protein